MGLRIYDFLPTGRDNAIPCKQLAQIMGFRSVRELQKALDAATGQERMDGWFDG